MKDVENKPELGNIHRHFWLMRSVAAAAGTDLGAAVQDGRLGPLEFLRMLTRCRGAGCGNACALWLTARPKDSGAVPEFCANREKIGKLAE